MSEISKKWVDEKYSEMFDVNECPEYDILVNYSDGKLDKKETHFIETHLTDCDLCRSVIESLENINEKSFDKDAENILLRIQENQEECISKNLESTSKNKIRVIFKSIYTQPVFKYSFSAAAGIVLVLITAYNIIKPSNYDLATFNSKEKEMILLSENSERGSEETEFNSQDLTFLLKSEENILGFIPVFNEYQINASIDKLKTLFGQTDDSFYQEKYAYFLGKLNLMKDNKTEAKKWLNRVVLFKSETLYSKYAGNLLKELNY